MIRSILATTIVALAVTFALADYESGQAAYEAGDYQAALRQWLPLAEQDDLEVQLRVGRLYLEGRGVNKDVETGMHWIRHAAEQGHAESQGLLGFLAAMRGNLEEAIIWLRRAAAQGEAGSQYLLAEAYAQGRGVEQDDAEALKWFREAAGQGVVQARAILRGMQARGLDTGGDFPGSIGSLSEAANDGDREAQYELGMSYLNGEGVPQEIDTALGWFELAAEQGQLEAQYELAVNKMGDPDVALPWFRRAAERGHVDSQSMLGIVYSGMPGYPEDLVEAYMWSSLAGGRGDSKARAHRDELERSMTPEQITLARERVRSWTPKE
jgi:TPR repeat protein